MAKHSAYVKSTDVPQSPEPQSGPAWPSQAPALRVLELPTRLQVPLSMRPGPAATAQKPPGSRVDRGEQLCDPGPEISPAALAPTSGRIVGTSRVQLLNGHVVSAVDIEPDFEDRPAAGESHDAVRAHAHEQELEAVAHVDGSDLAHWIDRLRDAGVWAERTGSPDLIGQLYRALRQPADTILCTLLDDEPTMRLNGILAARSGPLMLAGVMLLARLTEAKQVMIVVEAGSPGKWHAPLRRLARKAGVDVVPVLNDYPESHPTMLLHSLLGRRLKPGRSPVEQKTVVVDAAAALAVARCATRQQSMLRVPIAIRDHISGITHYIVAPVGSPLRQVLEQCDVSADGITIRRGSVLHENEVSADAVVSGGELTLHAMPRHTPTPADPCIRCGWCAESCPTRVQPAGVLEAAQRGDVELGQVLGLDACIECGVCSYVCPSHLPLLAGIRALKSEAERGTSRLPSVQEGKSGLSA